MKQSPPVAEPHRASMGRVYVGPSGWSYPDWSGCVYPARRPARFDALAELVRYFDSIEINSSFYRPPAARTTASWLRRIASRPDFRFTCKLWRGLTHERADEPSAADAAVFREGMAPLVEAGRLACVLVQFPWSFRCEERALEYVARLCGLFGDLRLVVEVRHSTWDSADARARLAALGAGICNIDQPLLRDCLAPAAHVSGPIGYVRFHGRRADKWFAETESPAERYDYLYGREALQQWVPHIRSMAERTRETYVFLNNHRFGQGPANALQLRALLEGGPVDVPPTLLRRFAFLRELATDDALRRAEEPDDGQPSLFAME